MQGLLIFRKGNYVDQIGVKPVLLVGASVFLSVSPLIPYEIRSLMFGLLGFVLLHGKLRLTRTSVLVLWFFAGVIGSFFVVDVVSSFESGFITLSFFYIPVCLFFGTVLSLRFTLGHYLHCLNLFMFPLTVISLIIFALMVMFPFFPQSLPEYSFWGLQHRTLVLVNVLYADGFLMLRNTGFANEPGVFQLFLNLALLHTLRTAQFSSFRAFVYLTAILTTGSTAGILIGIVTFFFYSPLSTKILGLFLFLIFSPFAIDPALYHLDNKWVGSAAFDVRFMPAVNAFLTILENPLGLGSVQYSRIMESAQIGSFDSYTQIALRFGIFGFFILLLLIGLLCRKDLGVAIILALTFFAQPIWYIPVVFGLLMFGLRESARNAFQRRLAIAS
ncbi:MAG: hypothetical protein H6918_05345 [Sphingomonadaceae bacterium]|nr:hypothetical protein [Sphingomonadaceae bacterium]